jgi:fluoroquinolone transport system permease protein
MTIPVLLGIPLNMICLAWCNLLPLTFNQLLLSSVSAALVAPFVALLLPLVASNKVEGFALAKVVNTITFPPILAWFFPGVWNWLFGVLPTWWPMKAMWMMADQPVIAWLVVALGIVSQLLWIALFWRWLQRKQLA